MMMMVMMISIMPFAYAISIHAMTEVPMLRYGYMWIMSLNKMG